MSTNNTTDKVEEDIKENIITHIIDKTPVIFKCKTVKNIPSILISCQVNYIDYEKEFTEKDIKSLHSLFNLESSFILDMVQKMPSSIKKEDDNIVINFKFELFGKTYNVQFIIPEKEIEGKDKEVIVLQRKVEKLESDNILLEERITELEKYIKNKDNISKFSFQKINKQRGVIKTPYKNLETTGHR